jgi:hypothetical protein
MRQFSTVIPKRRFAKPLESISVPSFSHVLEQNNVSVIREETTIMQVPLIFVTRFPLHWHLSFS